MSGLLTRRRSMANEQPDSDDALTDRLHAGDPQALVVSSASTATGCGGWSSSASTAASRAACDASDVLQDAFLDVT